MPEKRAPSPHYLGHSVILFCAYFATAYFGLKLDPVSGFATLVWPPAGIATAALFLLGYRFWPGVALAALLVNTVYGAPWPVAAAIAAGNTLEAVTATRLLRSVRFRPALNRLQDVLAFLTFAAFLSAMISATIGVTSLWMADIIALAEYAHTWTAWWIGDMLGIAVFAPVLLTNYRIPRHKFTRKGVAEALGLLLLVLLTGEIVFGRVLFPQIPNAPLAYLVFFPLILAALRFGQRGTLLVALTLSLIAIYGTSHGYGPFVRDELSESLLYLHLFIGAVLSISMILAAVVAERETALDHLDVRVKQRTADLERANEELRHKEALLSETQHAGQVGCWEWNVGDDHVTWSDEMYRLHGLPPQIKIDYRDVLKLVHPDDRAKVDSAVKEAVARIAPFQFDRRVVWPDGTVRWLTSRGRVYAGSDGTVTHVMGTTVDITDMMLIMQELTGANEQLKKMDQRRREFLATISHELRTPLVNMQGAIDTLFTGRAGEHTEMQLRIFDLLNRNNLRLARLIENLLNFSLIEAGKFTLEKKSIDLRDPLRLAVDSQTPLANKAGLACTLDLPSSPVLAPADHDRFIQIVSNLIDNAIRFAKSEITIALKAEGGMAIISVEDDGPGIPPERKDTLFQPFAPQEEKSWKRHVGLGLSIVKSLTEAHGGDVSFQSPGDEGPRMRFIVKLPLKQ